jgi:hypothetical protein
MAISLFDIGDETRGLGYGTRKDKRTASNSRGRVGLIGRGWRANIPLAIIRKRSVIEVLTIRFRKWI